MAQALRVLPQGAHRHLQRQVGDMTKTANLGDRPKPGKPREKAFIGQRNACRTHFSSGKCKAESKKAFVKRRIQPMLILWVLP